MYHYVSSWRFIVFNSNYFMIIFTHRFEFFSINTFYYSMSGFNYSKWDHIGDSDSDSDVDNINNFDGIPNPNQLDRSKMLHLEGSRLPPSAPIHKPDIGLPIVNKYGPYKISDFANRTDENDPMPPQYDTWWKERDFVLHGKVMFSAPMLRPEIKQLIIDGKIQQL